MAENKGAFGNPATIKNGRPAVVTNLNMKGNNTVSVKKSNVKVCYPTMKYEKISKI